MYAIYNLKCSFALSVHSCDAFFKKFPLFVSPIQRISSIHFYFDFNQFFVLTIIHVYYKLFICSSIYTESKRVPMANGAFQRYGQQTP
uniref:Ovule protein n=1 Tax=Haemonchus placei TaxID=6290 RepID=A0A0N4WLD9_HAEPC